MALSYFKLVAAEIWGEKTHQIYIAHLHLNLSLLFTTTESYNSTRFVRRDLPGGVGICQCKCGVSDKYCTSLRVAWHAAQSCCNAPLDFLSWSLFHGWALPGPLCRRDDVSWPTSEFSLILAVLHSSSKWYLMCEQLWAKGLRARELCLEPVWRDCFSSSEM